MMPDRPQICPDPTRLEKFSLGKQSGLRDSAIEQHLQECAACRQKVEQFCDSFTGKLRDVAARTGALVGGAIAPPKPIRPPERVIGADTIPGLPKDLANQSKYRVVKELGRGGMGVVYLAEHLMLKQQRALKVLNSAFLSHPDAIPRFHKEVQAAGSLKHPFIVQAHDAEQIGELHALVMEYVEGNSLDRLVAQRGPLPIAEACRAGLQTALGLQYAHDKGMVHRDIKPQNLMNTPEGQVKILDFGLARQRNEQSITGGTAPNTYMGTAEYVAPEQARNAHAADIRADIYSLGCTLYHLLAGRPPFVNASYMDTILDQLHKEPVPLRQRRSEVPPELEAVVARMLKKDPAERYQAPKEVVDALKPFARPAEKARVVSSPPAPVAIPLAWDTKLPGETKLPPEAQSGLAPTSLPIPIPPPEAPLALVVPGPKSAAGNDRPRRGPSLWLIGGGIAGLLALVLAAAVWLRPVGTTSPTQVPAEQVPAEQVLVEISEPGARLLVDGRRIDVGGGDQQPIKIRVEEGPHELTVEKDGFETKTQQFTYRKGKTPPIKVALVRKVAPPPPPDPPVVWKGPKDIVNSIGMKFVRVPAGKFLMGSSKEEQDPVEKHLGESFGVRDENPQHEVEITKAFYLGVYEVTQKQFKEIMGYNPSHFSADGTEKKGEKYLALSRPAGGKGLVDGVDTSQFPVENVSWEEAVEFCTKLGALPAEKKAGWVHRLPTEAQWEYACRAKGAADSFFHYGDRLSYKQANFQNKDPYTGPGPAPGLWRTREVGSYKPNDFGLYDMHGNVAEWCLDAYRQDYYKESPKKDPRGPGDGGRLRVFRGGDWNQFSMGCRSAYRTPAQLDYRIHRIGFRVALVRSSAEKE